MNEKFWFIKQCELFDNITPDEIDRLESRSRVKQFARNSPVYLPADDDHEAVFLLVNGRVKICFVTPDGKESILALIEPGELFGESVIFEKESRNELAVAVEKSTVVAIPAAEVGWLMKQHSNVSYGLTKLIGLRRQRIERRLKNLLFLSNRQKITHLLLDLVEQYGKPTAEGCEMGIKLSHQDLANIIGSTRETVTLTLGELQSAQLLKVGRRRITIMELKQLAQSVSRPVPDIGGTTNAEIRPGVAPVF